MSKKRTFVITDTAKPSAAGARVTFPSPLVPKPEQQQPELDFTGPINMEALINRNQTWDELYTKAWSSRERKQPFRYCDFYLQVMATKVDHEAEYEKYRTVLLSEKLIKKLPQKLIHFDVFDEDTGETQRIPIVNYTQQRLFNLLQALEWYVGGHPFEDGRNMKWIEEMEDLIKVIKVPLMKMIALPLSSHILSMADYTIETARDGSIPASALGGGMNASLQQRMNDIGLTEADYYSDEEKRSEIRHQMNRKKEAELMSEFMDTHEDEDEEEEEEEGEEDELGTTSATGMKETTRRVNMDFIHDVSWMMREIEMALSEARMYFVKVTWMKTIDEAAMTLFRRRAVEQISGLSSKMVMIERKVWQIDVQCVESLKAKYGRKNKKLPQDVTNREALGPFSTLFVEDYLPTDLASMFKEHDKVPLGRWVKVNVDFLFYLNSRNQSDPEEGNVYDYLLASKTVKKIRALNKYVILLEEGWYGFSSLVEAFLALRKEMNAHDVDPAMFFGGSANGIGLKRINLGQFDEWFGFEKKKKKNKNKT
jgi:hypothetical protein